MRICRSGDLFATMLLHQADEDLTPIVLKLAIHMFLETLFVLLFSSLENGYWFKPIRRL